VESIKHFQSALTSFVRRYWMIYSRERKETIQESKVFEKDSIRAKGHKCFICENVVKQKDFKIHHIVPTGSLTVASFEKYIVAMFCKKSLLVGLCHQCHLDIHKKMKELQTSNLEELNSVLKELEKTKSKSYVIIAKFLLSSVIEKESIYKSSLFKKLNKKYNLTEVLC